VHIEFTMVSSIPMISVSSIFFEEILSKVQPYLHIY